MKKPPDEKTGKIWLGNEKYEGILTLLVMFYILCAQFCALTFFSF